MEIKVTMLELLLGAHDIEAQGVHSLLYFACVFGPIYWGGGEFTLKK